MSLLCKSGIVIDVKKRVTHRKKTF